VGYFFAGKHPGKIVFRVVYDQLWPIGLDGAWMVEKKQQKKPE
jgi:hypothetical protein